MVRHAAIKLLQKYNIFPYSLPCRPAISYFPSREIRAIFRIFVPNKPDTHCILAGQIPTTDMGRNKFSQHEINCIARLLRKKNAGTRYQQKLIRHHLRVDFEFNISDFNVQGKAFGEEELHEAIRRGAIHILDDATIQAMKAKRAAQKAAATADKAASDKAADETTDWQTALKEWEDYYGSTPENEPAAQQPATNHPLSSTD